MNAMRFEPIAGLDIAIVGMSCRVPGADSYEEYWRNLREGRESISRFSADELIERGVPEDIVADPAYVRAGGVLENADAFDAAYFRISPRESGITDPQHRVFLECSVAALEDAGYDPGRVPGYVGVFAGAGTNAHLLELMSDPATMAAVDGMELIIGNDKDYLATRTSYKLGLRGPSITVQTACSTSLVAVHLACQSLSSFECDMAIAGGVSISVRHRLGYLYQEGGIASPDGRCRPFDAAANGTVGGSGVGLVVLKRLEDALQDHDEIRAVIRGSAVNNDGSQKVGYTAPSEIAQAEVVAQALACAGLSPADISYVEAHGTGTKIGDPIEIAALARVFGDRSSRADPCLVGSVKGNIGHLDAAAGVAGLIKTVLALGHRELPASLHFSRGNPLIDWDLSPFCVSSRLTPWESPDAKPRRAGVSSFGIGGSNAHVILEEAPGRVALERRTQGIVLPVSAESPAVLAEIATRLSRLAREHPEVSAADIGYTLGVGRRPLRFRSAVVLEEEVAQPSPIALDPGRFREAVRVAEPDRSVTFMFTGQGSQHVGMARDLYRDEPFFRDQLDRLAVLFPPNLGREVLPLLVADSGGPTIEGDINRTELAQPALFAVEYALAQLLMSWGVRPESMIGHSVGEWVAACIAGVVSLADAVSLIAARGRLIGALPRGAMLAVALSEEELTRRLAPDLDLAAVNGPALCTVSGTGPAIEAFAAGLRGEGLAVKLLSTSHAFHSRHIEPALAQFRERCAAVALHPPAIPFVSNITGTWITASEATDPDYWVRHARMPVRFAAGIRELLGDSRRAFVEVGPGQTLTGFVRQIERSPDRLIESCQSDGQAAARGSAVRRLAASLWSSGVDLDWDAVNAPGRRVALPTYPFERVHFNSTGSTVATGPVAAMPAHDRGAAAHTSVSTWQRTWVSPGRADLANPLDIVFVDDAGIGGSVATALAERGRTVVRVVPGERFEQTSPDTYRIDPLDRLHYREVLDRVADTPGSLRVAFCWGIRAANHEAASDGLAHLSRTYRSLAFLAQAAAAIDREVELVGVTCDAQAVLGTENVDPWQAAVLGTCLVVPLEYPAIRTRVVDTTGSMTANAQLLADLVAGETNERLGPLVGLRGRSVWLPAVTDHRLAQASRSTDAAAPLDGVYLITGAFGLIGKALARHLAGEGARLVLVGRTIPGAAGGPSAEAELEGLRAKLGIRREDLLVAAADVTDEREVRTVVDEALLRFGPMTGVFHLAGPSAEGTFLPIDDIRHDDGESFSAKVAGTVVLERVFRDRPLDFCLVSSSLASVVGGVGFAAYATANAFIDAFVQRLHNEGNRAWTAVNLDRWRMEGPATEPTSNEWDRPPLTERTGIEALVGVVRGPRVPQVYVSTQALRIGAGSYGMGSSDAPKPVRREVPSVRRTPFVPATSVAERRIASLWEEVLGIASIGVRDSFFELGGHSLLAIQLAARIRSAFDVSVPLRELLAEATIEAQAVLVEEALLAQVEGGDQGRE